MTINHFFLATDKILLVLKYLYYLVMLTEKNGKDALNYFLSHEKEVDLLITDAIMPEMDGFELLQSYIKKELI